MLAVWFLIDGQELECPNGTNNLEKVTSNQLNDGPGFRTWAALVASDLCYPATVLKYCFRIVFETRLLLNSCILTAIKKRCFQSWT